MEGSLGAWKTLLVRARPGILAEMSIEESLGVRRSYSVADQLPPGAGKYVFDRRGSQSNWISNE
jgi:hypothetical protein